MTRLNEIDLCRSEAGLAVVHDHTVDQFQRPQQLILGRADPEAFIVSQTMSSGRSSCLRMKPRRRSAVWARKT